MLEDPLILSLYTYKARLVSVYDGDTYRVDIDLGMGVWRRDVSVRLYGLNTPEIKGPQKAEGIKVRDFVREMLTSELIVRTHKDKTGKFGRLLAEVFFIPEGDTDYCNLGTMLEALGYAVAVEY